MAAAAEPTDRPPPAYLAKNIDQAEGKRALEEFRGAGIAGDYWLSFELRVMPRRGADRILEGRMLGARRDAGPITRLSMGGERWLIYGGRQPVAWRWSNGSAVRLAAADLFQPIAGTDLTVFDLQMPFLYWNDSVYEGLDRVRGRPAHRMLLYPPAETAGQMPGVAGVRVYLDTQFQALLQAELLDPRGSPVKTITVLDLKRTGEQWIVKSIDLRNHATRDKTRLSITAAALGLAHAVGVLDPDGLGIDAPPVPVAAIERF